ncbi:hypothetical protein N9U55_01970 [Luminiphilus sp.]|nr:hypothetical protein [Luminiphilus sp.]MDA9722031.1 hypothetical protein [Luminiphilus sp.]
MLTPPETSTNLKPEFIVVVEKIYRDLCNLQPGTNVLIITDSRTPRHVVTVFMGMAMAKGAVVSVSENVQAPSPANQPGFQWHPMLVAAASKADLIIDLAIGYADFMAEAIERGAQVLSPGDGTGGYHLEDSLIRTMLDVDLEQLRREAIQYANMFEQANELRITSEEGTDFTVNIKGLESIASHEYLWDPDTGEKISAWSALPPAAPGLVLPKHAGDGVVAVDGFVLYDDVHEVLTDTVLLTFEKGKIVNIEGKDRLCAARLSAWLDALPDDSGKYGPVHLNLGLNPHARLTEHPEFEKIRGTLCLGIGDSSLLTRMWSGAGLEPVISDVHWDVIVMRPTITLDGRVICDKGILPAFESGQDDQESSAGAA